MINACVVFGCKSGYSSQSHKVSGFSFPFEKPDLLILVQWIKFVNRKNWKPSKHSIICAKHFKDELIKDGQRKKLKVGTFTCSNHSYRKSIKTSICSSMCFYNL